MTRLDKSGERGRLGARYHAGVNVLSILRHHGTLPPLVARRDLPAMITKEEDIVDWAARVAELERQLDAAAKLSEVRMIASELVRTRKALNQSKAKLAVAARHPRRGTCRQSGRRSASSAAERAGS
jgi:hypothetical protein